MTIEDNLIYRERSKEVGRVLEKIFTERCGLAAEVEFLYKEAEKKDPMDQPVFMKPGGELIMGTRNEENYLEGTAESAPWDEGPANGGFSGTFGDGNGDAGAGITAQSAGNSGSAGRSGAADGGKKAPGEKTASGSGASKQKTDAAGKPAETRTESLPVVDRTAAVLQRRLSARREKAAFPAASGKVPTEGSRTGNRRIRMFCLGAILKAMR